MRICELMDGFLWIFFVVVWVISALRVKRTIRSNYWKFSAPRLFLFIGVLFLGRIESHSAALRKVMDGAHNPIISILGLAISVTGFALAVWARIHIGRNWGTPMSIKENPELVTSGPYSFVRHPIYTGVMVAMIGSAIVQGVYWLYALVITLPYFVLSAIKEEKTMTTTFPIEYPEYKLSTKMLIPFLF